MLILTSLTACWHESINITRDNLHPRSYADDLSATVAQRTETQLKDSIRQVHSHTQNFGQVAGLKINARKTFTFGHRCLTNLLPSIPNHKDAGRLSGAVVKVPSKDVGLNSKATSFQMECHHKSNAWFQ